jgi:lysyl-tRNA synthetase class 2
MKRLLAAGSGPIYQICKVFRDGEAGAQHNPEFTLLEWYRPGYDHHTLMCEVSELVERLLGIGGARYLTYREAFTCHAGIDPFDTDADGLRTCAWRHGVQVPPGIDGSALWDLLLSHMVEPHLGLEGPLFLYDFPVSQAALARVRGDVAERFGLYLQGVEIAHGFHALRDAQEQRRRFEHDRRARREAGLPDVPIDEHLLAALEAGLPDCAGVALGIDRLLMVGLGKSSIEEVVAFPLSRA